MAPKYRSACSSFCARCGPGPPFHGHGAHARTRDASEKNPVAFAAPFLRSLAAVKAFKPLTDKQTADLLARSAAAAAAGEFERFKTTNGFDGTANNPKWLGEPDKGPG